MGRAFRFRSCLGDVLVGRRSKFSRKVAYKTERQSDQSRLYSRRRKAAVGHTRLAVAFPRTRPIVWLRRGQSRARATSFRMFLDSVAIPSVPEFSIYASSQSSRTLPLFRVRRSENVWQLGAMIHIQIASAFVWRQLASDAGVN